MYCKWLAEKATDARQDLIFLKIGGRYVKLKVMEKYFVVFPSIFKALEPKT